MAWDYLTGLLKRGYTIGMDHLTWGVGEGAEANPNTLSWQRRARTVKKLIEAGFCHKIFLSNDWYEESTPPVDPLRTGRSNAIGLEVANPGGLLAQAVV